MTGRKLLAVLLIGLPFYLPLVLMAVIAWSSAWMMAVVAAAVYLASPPLCALSFYKGVELWSAEQDR